MRRTRGGERRNATIKIVDGSHRGLLMNDSIRELEIVDGSVRGLE